VRSGVYLQPYASLHSLTYQQTGHYSYECKATTQERPYIPRPSRTQQLFNPKLQPKLTEAAPPEDLTKPKGVADIILKAKEDERSRKRPRDGYVHQPARRAAGYR
jgi:hypothetical protein